ncbi:hypothetical protein QJQ45_008292 [Haematococcus lacustris]|nr:hypothetical protein QJQ45_008292 [Haematococcus lacustris]
MWCPVVAPRKPPQPTCSRQAATQPTASAPGPSTPPPAKRSKRTKAEQAAEPKSKAVRTKPAPQPGRWLDRDCNAALNMQRIGESRWRPLELCYWPEQGALPAKGKEYPGLGYKRLQDHLPKAQQLQQPAEAQPPLPSAQAPPPPPAQPLPAAPGPVPPPQAPSWGRWLDRDTNACFNFQRIGESMQRPLELCSWKEREALPPVGKEYQQGYKRVNDRLPKVRQRLHRAVEYRRGIDGRTCNNA